MHDAQDHQETLPTALETLEQAEHERDLFSQGRASAFREALRLLSAGDKAEAPLCAVSLSDGRTCTRRPNHEGVHQ